MVILLYIKCFHREAKLCFSQEASRWGPLYKKIWVGKGKIHPSECMVPKKKKKTRRDRNAFLREQCKETEESNRLREIRDLIKKIRDTKGTFHAKMGTIKERNSMAEDIKKTWQKYTEELYKKKKKILMKKITMKV